LQEQETPPPPPPLLSKKHGHKSLPMVYIKPSGICLNIGKDSVSLLYSKTTTKTETTTSKTIPNFGVSSNVLVCPFNSTKGHLGSSFQLALVLHFQLY